MRTPSTLAVAVIVGALLSACGGATLTSQSVVGPSTSLSSHKQKPVSATESPVPVESPVPTESNPPGDIPDSIAFVEGHGFGHGVGLCQWCAEARAEQGESAEQILAAAFPKAKLKRAY